MFLEVELADRGSVCFNCFENLWHVDLVLVILFYSLGHEEIALATPPAFLSFEPR